MLTLNISMIFYGIHIVVKYGENLGEFESIPTG